MFAQVKKIDWKCLKVGIATSLFSGGLQITSGYSMFFIYQ